MIHKTVHKYFLQRHRIIYFRWRVPAELQTILGLKEIRFSLRTSSFLVAQTRANNWFDFINHVKLMKSAYQFSEISKADYIQAMKKKIEEIQFIPHRRTPRPDVTELITVTHGGVSFDIDYGGDEEKESKVALLLSEGKVSKAKLAGVTLSQFFDEFLEYKSTLTEKMKQSYQLYIKTLIEMMGDNDIALIEQGDIKNALLDFLRMPKRNLAKYKNFSVSELLEMEIDDEDRLAEKSVSHVKKLLQGMFSYAVQKKYVTTSVMQGLRMNLSSKVTFAKYDDAEVLRILDGVNQRELITKKWMCWLAAYTGARRGEIIQLRKQDVKVDSRTNRYYLLITEDAGAIKTDNAHRQVPIHKKLIDEGFLKYAQSRDDKLFDGLKAETFTQWFGEFRESLGIAKYDDFNQRKVFHSFRHTFITKSRAENSQVDKVQQVVGHEKIHFGVTDRYSHTYDIIQILDVVDKVSFAEPCENS